MPIYVKYGDIKGDVTAEGHKGSDGWFEVQSFQWGVGRGISAPTGKNVDREASAPSVSEITMTKSMDIASYRLLDEALQGEIDVGLGGETSDRDAEGGVGALVGQGDGAQHIRRLDGRRGAGGAPGADRARRRARAPLRARELAALHRVAPPRGAAGADAREIGRAHG